MHDDDIQEQLLIEAKKITAFIAFQKKLTKWMLITFGICAVLGIGVAIIMEVIIEQDIRSHIEQEQRPITWYDVDTDVRYVRLDDALAKANSLLQQFPNDESGHRKIAHIYLIKGELEQAQHHFETAYTLFPSEVNTDNWQAIQTRMQREGGTLPQYQSQ